MSQEKAQLIAPLGVMAAEGITATGVITATTLDGNIVGSAKSLVNGANVSVGVITATSFDGNLTGNIKRLADSAPDVNAGVTTATSFVGNLTGSVTDLTSQPAITVGLVTATSLSGPITGNVTGDVDGNVTGNVTGNIVGDVTGNVTGNATGLAGGLGVNYNGGWTGAGTSQVRAGVVTATFFYGDGSNLDGVSSGPVSKQSIGITSAATTIDLSNGNLILAHQSANTTVSFANTANGNVYFVRTKDDTTTDRTITWPHIINWDGGSAPTLITNDGGSDKEGQVFLLVTRDMGVTWYGKEIVNYDTLTGYELWAVGNNEYGILGQNATENARQSSPVQIGTASDWSVLPNAPYAKSIVAIKSNKEGWLVGRQSAGSLGDNVQSNTQYSSPVQIANGAKWATLAQNHEKFTFGSKTDGTLWAWGNNQPGRLGQNKAGWPASVSSPTQIPGTNWGTTADTLTGTQNGCNVIKTDGTLWVWGDNSTGQLGQNDTNSRSSPAQIPGTQWSKVNRGGNNYTGAIRTGNTLWLWGYNSRGQLGLNNTNNGHSSPVQIPGNTWRSLTVNYDVSLATKTDGTLWMWGNNENGELGQNDDNNGYSSPTQVGSGTDWSTKHHTAQYNVYAIKTNGTLWSWGRNFYGQMGQNDTVELSSPTQVGTDTNWIDVYGCAQSATAFLRSSS